MCRQSRSRLTVRAQIRIPSRRMPALSGFPDSGYRRMPPCMGRPGFVARRFPRYTSNWYRSPECNFPVPELRPATSARFRTAPRETVGIDRPRRPDHSPTPAVPRDRSPITNTRRGVRRTAPDRAMFSVPPIVIVNIAPGGFNRLPGGANGSGPLSGPHPAPRRPPPIPPDVRCAERYECQSGRPGRGASVEPGGSRADGASVATPSLRLRSQARPPPPLPSAARRRQLPPGTGRIRTGAHPRSATPATPPPSR